MSTRMALIGCKAKTGRWESVGGVVVFDVHSEWASAKGDVPEIGEGDVGLGGMVREWCGWCKGLTGVVGGGVPRGEGGC